MTWTPFFIGLLLLIAFAFAVNFGFGQAQFRNAVKNAHKHKGALVTIIVCVIILTPFAIMFAQH
ncbi:MAG: hypothetical protein ACOH5I_07775 [Oligoflexus sp.]